MTLYPRSDSRNAHAMYMQRSGAGEECDPYCFRWVRAGRREQERTHRRGVIAVLRRHMVNGAQDLAGIARAGRCQGHRDYSGYRSRSVPILRETPDNLRGIYRTFKQKYGANFTEEEAERGDKREGGSFDGTVPAQSQNKLRRDHTPLSHAEGILGEDERAEAHRTIGRAPE